MSTRTYTKHPYINRRSNAAKKIQRWVRSRKSANSQSKQISKAFKKISSIRTDMRKASQKYGMYNEWTSDDYSLAFLAICPAATTDSTYSSTFPAWANCFANNENAQDADRVRLGRCHMKMQFTSDTERSPVTYSIFHVRLNPKNAQYVTQKYGPGLSAISGTPELYVRGQTALTTGKASGAANVMLNPDYLIVKKCWRFTLSQYVATNDTGQPQRSAQNTGSGTLKNIDYSFPLNYTLGKGVGKWKELSAYEDTDPALRNYFLIFSNNLTSDSQSNSYSILAQCTATYK